MRRTNLTESRILVIEKSHLPALATALNLAKYQNIKYLNGFRNLFPQLDDFAPELVILDFQAPDSESLEVLDGLVAMNEREYLPILVLTRDAPSGAKERAFAHGAHDVLSMPFDTLEVQFRIRNLLQMRQTHLQLKAQNLLLRQQAQRLENATECVWIVDNRLRTVCVNDRLAEMLGSRPDEMQWKAVSEIMWPEDAPAHLPDFHRCNWIASTSELRLKRADGTAVWVLMTTSPMMDSEGRRSGTLAMLTDISKRKMRDEEILLTEKLEAVARFASALAHDFNNILTIIVGQSQLLLRRMGTESPLRACVEKIDEASDQAVNLTQQMLSFTPKLGSQAEVIDLNSIVANFESPCRAMFEENTEVAMKLDAQMGAVRGDAGLLTQVLASLAANARDAMPGRGKFTISTANVESSGSATYPAGAYILLTVQDTGRGLDAGAKAHLFEPFASTKNDGTRSGMGLSIVHRIVTRHGGWIDIESDPGHGACFKIYLPRSGDEVKTAPSPERRAEWPGGNETILVVEDRREIRTLVRKTLDLCGYTILEASDGLEGLEVYESYVQQIDLVITDLTMPRLGGFELGQRIRQQQPATKMLYMTGHSDEATEVDASDCMIQKPFTPEALARRVREILEAKPRPTSILVADDQREICELLRTVLESEGYQVHTAGNGREAIAVVKSTPISVVLTDLAMPERDGLEMIGEIRKDYPDMKIIAMSGTFAGVILESAKHLGADAILPKPLQVADLLKTLLEL